MLHATEDEACAIREGLHVGGRHVRRAVLLGRYWSTVASVSRMTRLKVANLSVNGRKHWPAVCAWLRDTRPDIATLQKIGRDEHFPEQDLRCLRYDVAVLPWRSSSDAGIAVLTRKGLGQQEVCVRQLPGADSDESRFLTVRVGDLWVSSVYAPYGPPPGDEQSSKPPHERAIGRRVAWLNRLRGHVDREDYGSRDALLCGDFNVKVRADGPLEKRDRYYSPREQVALEEIIDLGFVDTYRYLHRDHHKNPGRTYGHHLKPGGTSRLHFILASKRMEKGIQDAWVELNALPGKPSVPLVVTLDRVGA